MRQIPIFFLMLLLAFCQTALGSENQNTPQSHVKVWQYYAKVYQSDIPPLFKAIEIKHDVRFKGDLEEFISSAPPAARFCADAIYTYAKIGGTGAAQMFDRLLRAETLPQKNVTNDQVNEKGLALKYMLKLGMKPSDEAIRHLKSEIMKSDKPKLLMKIACGLKALGIRFSNNEILHIKKVLTDKWSEVDGRDLRILGIQPEWKKTFKTVQPVNERRLPYLLMIAGDMESKKAYFKTLNDLAKKSGKTPALNLWFGSSIGDKTSINQLLKSMNYYQAKLCEKYPELFPNEILFKAEKIISKHQGYITIAEFLREYQ